MKMYYNAHIVLYDRQGRILLQQRADTATNYPGIWSFFGGGSKAGETPLATVNRETLEELNLRLARPKLLAVDAIVKKLNGRTVRVARHVFFSPCPNKRALRLNEGQGMGWFRLSEIPSLAMLDQDRALVAKIGKLISKPGKK